MLVLYALLVAVAATAADAGSLRIAGGEETNVETYPYMAVLLSAEDFVTFKQQCGGSILNNRAILTAAHCFFFYSYVTIDQDGLPNWSRSVRNSDMVQRNRVRLGSSYANSGGTVFNLANVIIHPDYTPLIQHDLAIVHTSTFFSFSNVIQPGFFAGSNYILPDDTPVTAIGFGMIGPDEPRSEVLRRVQMWTYNRELCGIRYPNTITEHMICISGRVNGTGQCRGDSGSPILHENVIIGVHSSSGVVCGNVADPKVSQSVGSYIDWIAANA
ncbi:trypsin, alkaline C-like isoform X2 [Anticarsia gemmatalis]|uniref:trypsin, alkaline C-like isoform X2 n=1 Tax=Anticarsia gemmatalis TaxID=129554 RepID=UPI003F774DE5